MEEVECSRIPVDTDMHHSGAQGEEAVSRQEAAWEGAARDE